MRISPMTWYEVLRERATCVYISPEEGLLGIWNGSLTVNWYTALDDGTFVATDCMTLGGDHDRDRATLEEAIQGAHEWAAYQRGEGGDDA